MRRQTEVTQIRVSQAIAAFESVHLRKPTVRHLCQMLHTTYKTLNRFVLNYSLAERLSRKMVEEAKALTVITMEEIHEKKVMAAKAPRRRELREAKLEAAIERVVRRAQKDQASVDFIHDYRRTFRGRVRATRIG